LTLDNKCPSEILLLHGKTAEDRIEYPGALYHITSRGNEKKAIFLDSKVEQVESKIKA
jgi:hypothetical protein